MLTKSFTALAVLLLTTTVQGAGVTSCYNNYKTDGTSSNTPAPRAVPSGSDVYECITFKQRCMSGDDLCTPAQIAAQEWTWRYAATTSDQCTPAAAASAIIMSDITCCTKDNCNKPPGAVDPAPTTSAGAPSATQAGTKGSGSGAAAKIGSGLMFAGMGVGWVFAQGL
ncbi:hypothetical protein HDV00_007371 [Rhizophlyctis rosea]|nr:hypothetical protein HDV00_007371 [Rhizophlyctis rosea]